MDLNAPAGLATSAGSRLDTGLDLEAARFWRRRARTSARSRKPGPANAFSAEATRLSELSHSWRAHLALRGLFLILAWSLIWRSARSATVGA